MEGLTPEQIARLPVVLSDKPLAMQVAWLGIKRSMKGSRQLTHEQVRRRSSAKKWGKRR